MYKKKKKVEHRKSMGGRRLTERKSKEREI